MKIALLAILGMGLLATQAQAEERWIGTTAFVSTVGCSGGYDPLGGIFNTLFRPAGVGTNGPNSNFNIFDSRFATGYFLANGSFNGNFKSVVGTVVGSGSAIYSNATIRFATQQPATIAASTKFITITGTIKNFDFQTGCNASFNTSLTKRPF